MSIKFHPDATKCLYICREFYFFETRFSLKQQQQQCGKRIIAVEDGSKKRKKKTWPLYSLPERTNRFDHHHCILHSTRALCASCAFANKSQLKVFSSFFFDWMKWLFYRFTKPLFYLKLSKGRRRVFCGLSSPLSCVCVMEFIAPLWLREGKKGSTPLLIIARLEHTHTQTSV